MRALLCAVACLLVLVPLSAAAEEHEALMQELEALGDSLEQAMVADDTEAMLAMYTDDAISLPNYGPRMDGIAAFREHHDQMAAAGMKILSFDGHTTDAWECGDQVIEIGTYTISLAMAGMPEPVEDHGKYMTIYQRGADGSLKIKAEIWNTDINPMAMHGEHGEMHGEHGEMHGEMHGGHAEHGEMHGGAAAQPEAAPEP